VDVTSERGEGEHDGVHDVTPLEVARKKGQSMARTSKKKTTEFVDMDFEEQEGTVHACDIPIKDIA
jgi:hypothetical protein